MAEKQKVKDYYAAGVHFITGGMAIPIILSFGIGFLLTPILTAVPASVLPIYFILSVLTTWLGVYYSAKHVLPRYSFGSPRNVVRMSTIYYSVPLGLIILLDVFTMFHSSVIGVTIISDVEYLVCIAVFNYASKKYIA